MSKDTIDTDVTFVAQPEYEPDEDDDEVDEE